MTQAAAPHAAPLSPSRLALWGIHFYQRRLSPHKGFRCAHAALHGGQSCSGAVADLIAQHGLLAAPLVAARFGECREAHTALRMGAAQAGLPLYTETRGVFCCGGIPIPFRCG